MALVSNEYWLNWLVGKGAGINGRAEKLWRIGKSEEVGFKARKKLITREREREKERVLYKGGKE